MTADPTCASVDDSAAQVARVMRDKDCGSLPVSDATGKIVGVITDRDLAVRGLAEELGPDALVSKLMTVFPYCCGADDDVQTVEKLMADRKVRRVPVVDENQRCIGVIAQADLARAATQKATVTDREVALVVERISSPGNSPHRATPPRGVDPNADTLLIIHDKSDR
ncbi:MAG TPA: CBS domain-containing protein [Gemmatimonadaceae bacterium]|jgi:predicted transcriptional regulator